MTFLNVDFQHRGATFDEVADVSVNNFGLGPKVSKHFVSQCGFSPKTVGFVDEDVGVLRCIPLKDIVELAQRFEIGMRNSEVSENVRPRSGIIFVQQVVVQLPATDH